MPIESNDQGGLQMGTAWYGGYGRRAAKVPAQTHHQEAQQETQNNSPVAPETTVTVGDVSLQQVVESPEPTRRPQPAVIEVHSDLV